MSYPDRNADSGIYDRMDDNNRRKVIDAEQHVREAVIALREALQDTVDNPDWMTNRDAVAWIASMYGFKVR